MSRIFTTIKENQSEVLDAGKFPLDALPEPMNKLAQSLADVHQIDVALPGMAALATLSGAIGKSVTVNGATNGQTTHCNLFIIAGAPKSYGKGSAAAMANPIIEASKELQDDFLKNERPKLQVEVSILERKMKALLKDSDGSTGRDELIKTQADLDDKGFILESIAPPSYYAGSCTGAALEEHLSRNDETAFSFSPEAGDMVRIALGQFTKKDQTDFELFLSGYSNEHLSSGRAGRGFKSMTPCISTLWMCQPSLLRELFGSGQASSRGLTARFLSFVCEHDEIPEDDGRERHVDFHVSRLWEDLVQETIEKRNNERIIETDADARESFRQWHNESVELRNNQLRDIEGEAGRWRENSIRIAGVLAVALDSDRVTKRIADDAIRLCRWASFSNLTLLNSSRRAKLDERKERLKTLLNEKPLTLRILEKNHGFAKGEVKHLCSTFPDIFILETNKPPSGRPSDTVRLNP